MPCSDAKITCLAITMLLELVKQKQALSGILGELQKPGRIVHGLTNSSKSFVLAELLNNSDLPVIFLTQGHHDSQIYYQEIKNLSAKSVFNFHCQEISPYEQINSDVGLLSNQYEIFQNWAKSETSLTVMQFKSLAQLYHNKTALQERLLHIDKQSKLSPNDLAKELVKLGYLKDHTVTNRAQFSQRGDIFDIYPIVGSPIRIEFFGDEIENIRTFSIESQRSIKNIDSFDVHPRYMIAREEADGFAEQLKSQFEARASELAGDAQENIEALAEADLSAAEEGLYWEGVEHYRSVFGPEPSSLFEFLPEECHIVFDEWEDLRYKAEEWQEQIIKQNQETIGLGKVLPLSKPLHLDLDAIKKSLDEYKQKLYIQTFTEETNGSAALSYEINTYPAERFASKVDMFVEAIKVFLNEGQQVVIFSEQPQRVLGILKEWDVPAIYLEKIFGAEGKSEDHLKTHPGLSLDDVAGTVLIQRDGTEEGFRIPCLNIAVLTDRELFGRSRQAVARQKNIIGSRRSDESFSEISQLKADDYVVHYKHGVGQYMGTDFVELTNAGYKQMREYLVVNYADESRILIPVDQVHLLSRYRITGDTKPKLSKLGGMEWDRTKKKVRKSVQKIAQDLINLYAVRLKQKGHQYSHDTPWQIEMEDAFPYTETKDQLKSIEDIKVDMQSEKLMDRLICGDAGFGKTEVVLRAAFKCVMEGKQVAVLVPTTVLAQQHYNVFSDRFAPYPVRVGLLSRFKTAKEQKDVVERLKIGECDIVIGTHRLIQKDIKFKNFGLLVIDEEQRFGVSHKEKLKSMRVDVDVITMSATPIPRTLHMALSGVRDISLISTAPVNRRPVKTYVGEYKDSVVRNAILHELERGGQVFFLHNRVETIERVAHDLKEMIPEATIGIAHGQMSDRDLEDVMFSFINEEFQILVCTTIIETGLDISTANTIILDKANAMGLSQLYQLRGRVGRSDVQAYAYFLYRSDTEISETARKRLKAIRELTRLGSGYQVALRDMEIRGVGNILGAEQHGHMLSVGFDLYSKLLQDSIDELKGTISESDFESESIVDINITAFFPEAWIEDKSQRMNEYKRLSMIRNSNGLNSLIEEWKDRFGKLPPETLNLIEVVKVKLLAKQAKVTAINQEANGIKIVTDIRLQGWLPIQRSLATFLQTKTVFKSGAIGSPNAQPYILVKTDGMDPELQIESIKEILTKLKESL